MPSPVTLRLDPETRERVTRIARRKGLSASEVIREAIATWLENQDNATPYERAADLLGIVHGGNPERSTDTGNRFKKALKSRQGPN